MVTQSSYTAIFQGLNSLSTIKIHSIIHWIITD